jgi:two-component system, cell cycle sensor histidine kinase and response regulator CckA
MTTPLNILIVEDSQDDADLIVAELRRAGFAPNWKRVELEADFLAEIKKLPDIILSDYSMPQFSGLRAAELLQQSGFNIPFILISGTVGEDVAVEAMKHGATDYLLKDRIARLGVAVEHALEQKRLREERQRAEASLNLFRTLVDRSSDGIEVIDPGTGRFLDVNETACQRLGYTREELLALRVPDIDPVGVTFDSWAKNVQEIRQAGFKIIAGQHRRKDGSTFPVEINVRYVTLERDYLIAAVRDITERKKLEAEVVMREQRLNAFFTAAPAGLALLDRQLRFVQINETVAKVNGLSVKNHLGKTVREVLPELASTVEPLLQQVLATGEPKLNIEVAGETPSQPGVLRHWLESFFPTLGEDGKPEGVGAIFVEITERKLADEKVRQLSHAVEQSPVSVVITDIKGNIEYVNRKFTELTGYSAVEVFGKNSRILKSGEMPAETYQQLWKTISKGGTWSGEFHNRKKNGELYWESASISPISDDDGKPTHYVAVKEDMTERRRAENALRESEERFRQVAENINEVFWMTDPTMHEIIYVSPAYEKIWGRSCESLYASPRDWLEAIHSEDREPIIKAAAEMQTSGLYDVEYRIIRPDKKVCWIHDRAFPVRNAAGEFYRIVGTAEDITERKLAESALRTSEERFRLVTENASDLISVINNEGVIRFQSPSVERILGYKPEDWFNRNAFEFVHPEDVPVATAALQRKVNEPDRPPILVDFRMRHHDGSWRIMQVIGQSIPNQKNEGFIVLNSRDITENRKLEEQFRQSQKMEAFGQLAGGVAHDFNNILAVIQMQAGMLRMEQDLSQNQTDYATEIEKASQRAADLTRQLLLFSRRQTLQPHNIDLNDIVANITKMLRRILREDIQMHFKHASQPLFIYADAGMMDQVLLNLTVNCRDAMPKGGDMFIETSIVEFDELAVAQSYKARPGAFICLSVSDTGCGISPENLPRIFEPFFTTKDVGKGTGLGLATVFGIVQQHQGWINVYSELGHGTAFRIYLPVALQTADKQSLPPALESVRGGDETILLVEDDLSLRVSVRNALLRLGYQVLEARTGVDALEVWNQNREKIDLLFTDMVMPDGMTGKELAGKLLQSNPKLKVIHTSGYSADVASRDIPLDEGVNFLAKPFETLKLAQTVRACLDKS